MLTQSPTTFVILATAASLQGVGDEEPDGVPAGQRNTHRGTYMQDTHGGRQGCGRIVVGRILGRRGTLDECIDGVVFDLHVLDGEVPRTQEPTRLAFAFQLGLRQQRAMLSHRFGGPRHLLA